MTISSCARWSTIIIIGLLLFVGIVLGSYGVYRGWIYKSWNDNVVPTDALIEGIDIINVTCEYNCNTHCPGSYFCKKCSGHCFDVYLNVSYGVYHYRYNIFTNITDQTLLEEQLGKCCVIGHNILLYYNRNDPHDVNIELRSISLFWVAVVATTIMTIICVAFIIYVYRRETKPFDYEKLYNDPFLAEYDETHREYF